MLQKKSKAHPIDFCRVRLCKIFHIFKGFKHQYALLGQFIKASLRTFDKKSLLKKGQQAKGIVVRLKKSQIKADFSQLFLKKNCVVLLKKRLTPIGRELVGPTSFGLRRRKFTNSFAGVL